MGCVAESSTAGRRRWWRAISPSASSWLSDLPLRVRHDLDGLERRQYGRLAVRLRRRRWRPRPIRPWKDRRRMVAQQRRGCRSRRSWCRAGTPMRLPARSFGVLTCVVSIADEAVPEHPRGEHRERDERAFVPATKRDTYSELDISEASNSSLPDHAVEQFARVVDRHEIEVDALGLHLAVWSASMRS